MAQEETDLEAFVGAQLDEHLRVMRELSGMKGGLARLARVVYQALAEGGKLLLFGNGGSAADCQHIAAELVNRFKLERSGYPAISLTTDTSALTSIANDYSFEEVFARQVDALGRRGDVALGISTSGNSPNVLRGLEAARNKGLVTAAFTGRGGGRMAGRVDYLLEVPSNETARIQEGHIFLGHLLCEIVERALVQGLDTGSPADAGSGPVGGSVYTGGGGQQVSGGGRLGAGAETRPAGGFPGEDAT